MHRGGGGVMKRSPAFELLWRTANILLLASIVFLIYSAGWEYSTRKYLRGFADAIIPAAAPPIEKVNTILNWMANGPARIYAPDPNAGYYRDPVETLNYQSLLRMCGTATNAFVNIANTGGIPARRLLLLSPRRTANHVVAEVKIDGRWIVVDPSFRFVPRGPNGQLLTRGDLSDPATFEFATQSIPNYSPEYNYGRTAHLRVARLPIVGPFLRAVLNRIAPGWGDSVYVTLLVERESFAALAFAIVCVVFFALARLLLRRYSETRLGIRRVRIRERLWQVFQTIIHEPS
ncbi:MAG: transglutaminase domain-containing protein [Candidatus Acidiferrales bacterium]